MNYNTDIEQIQSLLAKYYDGATTSAEEYQLKNLFAQISDDALPADLRADKVLFTGMIALDTADVSIEPPQELVNDLDKLSNKRLSQTNFWPIIRRYAALAAAIAILVVLIVRLSPRTEDIDLVASTDIPANGETMKSVSTTMTHPDVETQTTISDQPHTSIAKATSSRPVIKRASQGAESYREVTDIDEAQEIARRCIGLLAVSSSETTRAAGEVDAQFNQVYQIITNI